MKTTTTAPATITVRILSVASGEPIATLPAETLAVGGARFERLFCAHHGAGSEVADEVSVDPAWAGGDDEARAAHKALSPELFDAAARLDAMDTGRPCFVLFEGAGAHGEDIWSRCEIVTG